MINCAWWIWMSAQKKSKRSSGKIYSLSLLRVYFSCKSHYLISQWMSAGPKLKSCVCALVITTNINPKELSSSVWDQNIRGNIYTVLQGLTCVVEREHPLLLTKCHCKSKTDGFKKKWKKIHLYWGQNLSKFIGLSRFLTSDKIVKLNLKFLGILRINRWNQPTNQPRQPLLHRKAAHSQSLPVKKISFSLQCYNITQNFTRPRPTRYSLSYW